MSANIFFDQYRSIKSFSEVGKCFPCRVSENMAVSAEIKLRLSSHKKTSPTYIENFMGDTQQQDILYLKELLSANVSRKKLAQCRMKNSSQGYLTTDVGYCFFYSIPE